MALRYPIGGCVNLSQNFVNLIQLHFLLFLVVLFVLDLLSVVMKMRSTDSK